MKTPKPTAENTVITPHRYWGHNVEHPASKRGNQIFSHWFPTRAEAEAARDDLIQNGNYRERA